MNQQIPRNKYPFVPIIVSIVVTALIVGGASYWRSTLETNHPSSPVAPSEPKDENANIKISLGALPITFQLPQGFAIFQTEGFEGGYATNVSVGKFVGEGHLEYAPLALSFLLSAYDAQGERYYKPNEYIDVVFENEKKSFGSPKYIQLFGNKAVQYTEDIDGSTVIIGYLRADQSQKPDEYLVTITSATYGSGTGFNQHLFDTVVSTLRVNQ